MWIRAGFDKEKLAGRFGGAEKRKVVPELIMIPVFNEFAGFIPVNRRGRETGRGFTKGLGPLFKAAKKEDARIYMLDGTYLGRLGRL